MAYLELEGVAKQFGAQTVVDDFSLAVGKGEFVSFLGPSGCGKTTTLQMIAGFLDPTRGAIRLEGKDLTAIHPAKRGLGIVFQSYALFPHMTAAENVAFGLEMRKVPRAERAERVRAALAMVGLAGYEDRHPRRMSGGQQQRVALARALVIKPSVLLLDEPLSNLDASLRLTMRTEIRRIQRELGVTTILVTHDQIEATTMADRIVVMNGGRVEQEGTAKELYERPATLFVATFIGSPPINLFDGVAGDACIRIREVAMPLSSPATGDVVVGIRPESVRANGRGMSASIAAVEPMGREVLYTAESALGTIRFVEAGADARLREGNGVALDYAPRDVLLFDKASGRRLEARVAS